MISAEKKHLMWQKNAISGLTLLNNSYKNFAKTLPSNTEVAGYKILLGENYKDTSLLTTLELFELADPELGACCVRLPVTSNSDKHIKELQDSDLKVLQLIQSHTRADNESKISSKKEASALIAN